jgi:iron complex outermembrane receptor protein/vitamin B12 transporter
MSAPNRTSNLRRAVLFLALIAAAAAADWAAGEPAPSPTITGAVVDPLGARVPGARVRLIRDGQPVAEATVDDRGEFSFKDAGPGRYRLQAEASGFETQTTRPFFAGAGGRVALDVALPIGIRQELVVTASGTEEPASQVAAPVTVIGQQTLDDLAKPTLLEALRLVPGAQVLQTGGRGGITSFFVRGGNSNFNKVLVDGVPVNEIGGAFSYSDLMTTGVESVEALRDANSVVHGSDAMAGVVSITTRRGQTRTPELSATLDGGSLSTHHEAVSLGGTAQRLDYFGAYSHFATDNDVPNNAWTNDSFVGRLGLAVGGAGDLSLSVRHARSDYGMPNSIRLFGLPDDSRQENDATYVSLVAQAQLAPSWHGVLRATSFQSDYDVVNPTPTGEAFDPFGFGANYLGDTVTVEGANGTRTTGRAIPDFAGTYPQPFASQSKRRGVGAQTTYELLPALALSAGARFEEEEGFSDSGQRTTTERDNYGAFLEARAKVRRRFYANAGLGYEHNAVFHSAWTPRASAAFYLREPSPTEAVGDTKLFFNLGRGIKAPSLAQEQSSLSALLAAVPGLSTRVEPIGPERSRSLDFGVEQGFGGGQIRLRAAWFENRYSDLIEFVSKPALATLGVPPAVVAGTAFGAYVNAASYRARGLETSAEGRLGATLRVMASYTYLDALVTESFSSSALGPAENPAYPGVPIGAFGPLVGARPFRRPAHSGNLLVTFASGPAQVTLAGAFAGRADDSTFLSDAFFGSSMLLPNRDLNAGWQKVDLSGSYRLAASRVKLYASVENLLDQDYTPTFGAPALPRTIRVGVTGTLGGDGARR